MSMFRRSKKENALVSASMEETEAEPTGVPPPALKSNGVDRNYADVYDMDEVDDTSSQGTITAYDVILTNLAQQAEEDEKEKTHDKGTLLQTFGGAKIYLQPEEEDEQNTSFLRKHRCVVFVCILLLLAVLTGMFAALLFEEDQQAGFRTNFPSNSTDSPTQNPTGPPVEGPTKSPTKFPTHSPTTPAPTLFPTTASPTRSPVPGPTTRSPTKSPTPNPTKNPTKFPTSSPTNKPTKFPTLNPTEAPTKFPTLDPTEAPTKFPTASPTTKAPTRSPVQGPTTAAPTRFPTTPNPTPFPTDAPTPFPTTASPTPFPTTTNAPTFDPNDNPCSNALSDTWKFCVDEQILGSCVSQNGQLVPGGEETYTFCADKPDDRIFCRCPNGISFDQTYGCSKFENVGDGCA